MAADEAGPGLRVLAVDGLSGAGKSTVGRRVAGHLGWGYLDTGATYRALTWALLRAGLVPAGVSTLDRTDDLPAATTSLLDALQVGTDPAVPRVLVGAEDVTAAIRGPEVTATVSAVSAVPDVRRQLVAWQRRTALALDGCVVEGRDIGAAVLPDAPLKIWLTASADARAERRAGDQDAAGSSFDSVKASLDRRDRLDAGRVATPAVPAPDAVVLDSSGLDVDAVVARVLDLAAGRGLPTSVVR